MADRPRRPSPSIDILGEACQECLWLLGLDGQIHYMNPRAARHFGGGGAADAADVTLSRLWPPEARFSLDRALQAAAQGQASHFRAFIHGADGSAAYWETAVSPVPDADGGAPTWLLATARDVTAEVETHAFLRSVIQLLPSPLIVRAADDRRLLLVNRAAEDLLGARLHDDFGWSDGEPVAPHVADKLRRAEDQVLATGEMQAFDFSHPPEAGDERREFTVKLLATHDDAGPRHLIALADDVTERHRAAEALRQALEAAEQASEAKSAFLANMSHELRTPLNGVIAGADLLARQDLSAAARDLVAMIRNSSAALERLLGDVLDLARADQGQIALERHDFHLGEAVRASVALVRPQAEEKGLALAVEVAPGADGLVFGDSARLHQVLSILIGNAVKFTETGNVQVRIARASQSDRVVFTVEDTGVGFDPARKAGLFARFQQADNSSTRRFGGAGLGLALARELVSLMGGTIDAEVRAEGGSRFWFDAPLPIASAGAAAPAGDGEPAGGLRVLLVDDHPTNRQIVQLMLSGLADVVAAEDGAEAVETFVAGHFDLVLMDIQMPVMDGHTAVRELRRVERAQGRGRTPVIMLTANNRAEHIKASLEVGADRHLGKPVTTRALFDAIEAVLAEPEASLYPTFGHTAP
ncbi:MAG: ATP-binding protein [Phenylobacterium sp.]|uniref:PAS domain-containing hybrid sensor histidine kinase/response regulator n=1 Tax=Phenylobacterium sp. TaxID=1871053 RepID=UPI00391A7173